MKRLSVVVSILVLSVLTSAASGPGRQQAPAPFYSVDTERRVEGTVRDIVLEPRYEDRAPFLNLVVEEKGTAQVFKVEVSPAWFFDHDLHKGERVKIVGSFYVKDGTSHLIARQVQAGGETYVVRDSRGFPSWRGGPGKGKGWRRGQGM
jgi:hypothetical protein